MTASLQPLTKAGSTPKITRETIGGVIRSWFKFLPKSVIAASSALAFNSA